MSCIWVSAQVSSQQELCWLMELIKKAGDMQIVFSSEPPKAIPQEADMDGLIADLLIRLGIRPKLKGYQYLETAIGIVLKDPEELEGITKRLYPSVAKKYKTTMNKVECAIRRAVKTAWIKGNDEEQNRIFGYCFAPGKTPTNTEFIVRLKEHIERLNKKSIS